MSEEKIGMYSVDEIYEVLTENVEGSFLNRSMVDAMIFKIKNLQQENQQLKSVLDEIREYIKYNATSNYFDADTNMFRREVDILQILDKVKE